MSTSTPAGDIALLNHARTMLQCIHMPFLRMHAAVVSSKEWKWKRKAFGKQVDALENRG